MMEDERSALSRLTYSPFLETHLGVSILERSDGSEDLGESDKSISSDLRPNVDRSGAGLRKHDRVVSIRYLSDNNLSRARNLQDLRRQHRCWQTFHKGSCGRCTIA
jgi:hypothetical protein